jgi:hypothetical protein
MGMAMEKLLDNQPETILIQFHQEEMRRSPAGAKIPYLIPFTSVG